MGPPRGETGLPGGLHQEARVDAGALLNLHVEVRKLGPFPVTSEVHTLIYSTNIIKYVLHIRFKNVKPISERNTVNKQTNKQNFQP